ncbi:hypothetical protein PENTCL1PPCAC_9773, partial [Pristionchus entomophagus]
MSKSEHSRTKDKHRKKRRRDLREHSYRLRDTRVFLLRPDIHPSYPEKPLIFNKDVPLKKIAKIYFVRGRLSYTPMTCSHLEMMANTTCIGMKGTSVCPYFSFSRSYIIRMGFRLWLSPFHTLS